MADDDDNDNFSFSQNTMVQPTAPDGPRAAGEIELEPFADDEAFRDLARAAGGPIQPPPPVAPQVAAPQAAAAPVAPVATPTPPGRSDAGARSAALRRRPRTHRARAEAPRSSRARCGRSCPTWPRRSSSVSSTIVCESANPSAMNRQRRDRAGPQRTHAERGDLTARHLKFQNNRRRRQAHGPRRRRARRARRRRDGRARLRARRRVRLAIFRGRSDSRRSNCRWIKAPPAALLTAEPLLLHLLAARPAIATLTSASRTKCGTPARA